MTTINIKIDYPDEITINGEYTTRGPVEMRWFPNTDLVVETAHEKIVVNTPVDQVVVPRIADKNLEVVVGANLKLAKNDVARYVIIDDTFAFRLPSY